MTNYGENFIVENGILKRYVGKEERVVIPEGITRIGKRAFSHASAMKSVRIPESVTDIEDWAFYCSHLTEIEIPESVTAIGVGAFCRCLRLVRVILPNTLTEIKSYAFQRCTSLTALIIPKSVVSIGQEAFAHCEKLSHLEIHANILLKNRIFGTEAPFPQGLLPQIRELYPKMDDAALKYYILTPEIWNQLDSDLQTEIFLNKPNKPLFPAYEACISAEQAEIIAQALLKQAEKPCTAKVCNLCVSFMSLFVKKLSENTLKIFYEKLKAQKNNAKALQAIEDDFLLSEMLLSSRENEKSLPEAEQKIMDILKKEKLSPKKFWESFQKYYGLSENDLPKLLCQDGTEANPLIAAYLLSAHNCGLFEEYKKAGNAHSNPLAYPNSACTEATQTAKSVLSNPPWFNKAGISPSAAEIVRLLDSESLQNALRFLADQYFGKTTRGRKLLLAEPICRYADEALMRELTARAPSWASSSSGIEAPPLKAFRYANAYSDTRAAMLFADRYHELSRYAAIRDTDEDTLRDRFLSDVGLNPNGTKAYFLGNGTVTAVLQKDLSFLIRLENGKTAKSIPKKGADESLYTIANADFSEMKKNVKKIVKNRKDILFADFLSGKTRTGEIWMESYTKNPLLRFVASLLVWQQNEKTFLLTENGAVSSDGAPYEILPDFDISLAHPMEMDKNDLTAWQKYFTANDLRQPFEQIWEPVISPETINEDRYLGCAIPYYRLTKREKHGIFVTDEDFHDIIEITFKDCKTKIERLDWKFHEIAPDDPFEVQSFSFDRYTRTVNHIAAYLDRVTVYSRILKDDISIERFLHNFTLAQIMEFIGIAAANGCVNVTALLMEYKNKTFSDFDPMDIFSLDF
ncbi:MAG: leucine-rich repeat protein [Clostridia bacterium]|nr:leucine-rich repeat protein [Clostridia bacterium]